jgi:uncharacterized protein
MMRKQAGILTSRGNLCDATLWIALSVTGHDHHTVASAWFDRLGETDTVFFCRATQQSFLRLLTNQAIFAPHGRKPLTDVEAWTVYDTILADDRVTLQGEPSKTEAVWRELTKAGQASPKRWMDAYLAAFCIAGGFRLITFDSAFQSFPGLDVLILK